MMSIPSDPDHPYLFVVAKRFIIAVLFAIILNIIVSSLSTTSFPFVQEIRQVGQSLALRLAVRWHTVKTTGNSNALAGDNRTRILILDIDEVGCRALSKSGDCARDRLGVPIVLHEILVAATSDPEDRPQAIVFDTLLPSLMETKSAGTSAKAACMFLRRVEPTSRQCHLANAKTNLLDIPVFSAIAYKPSANDIPEIDLADSLCGKMECGNLTYAPAIAAPPMNGEIVAYTKRIQAELVDSRSTPPQQKREVTQASLALAVACGIATNPQSELCRSMTEEPVNHQMDQQLLIFDALQRPRDEDISFERLGSKIERIKLSNFIQANEGESGHVLKQISGLSNTILLVGTTEPAAGDRHSTPVGELPGVVILANAIHSFELAKTMPTRKAKAGIEWSEILVQWVVLLVTIAAITWLEFKKKEAPQEGTLVRRALVFVGYLLAIILILATSFLTEIALLVAKVLSAFESVSNRNIDKIDLIFPLASIFFTTGVELSHRLIKKFEQGLDLAYDALKTKLERTGSE